ncbi:E3 SUMO-protein ligase ZBED1-like [Paramisgurnus dabryanus]|uniref:E3 SUMO-protein ligase ZBED1-like n=1 Tax=Paramisgurnus dabryanus TaxID=90735 RepID=UPI0031F3DD47
MPRVGLERRVDQVDYVDYVITSICRKCVDASHCLHLSFETMAASAHSDTVNPALNQTARTRSKVWEFFKQRPNKMVLCTLCKMEMAYHSSTTSMHEHLKRKHPGALRPQNDETAAKRQSCVSDFFQKRNATVCTPIMAAGITDSILKMIVKDMRPLSIVEGRGFREMVSTLCPGYTLPSRPHFTTLMENKYEMTLEKVKTSLKKVKTKITLTTDAWTSIATEAYLGVTCHFINENWELISYNLTTMPLEERHTAENIAGWVEQAAEKFGISMAKVLVVVHDIAANVVAALRILEERHRVTSLRCAGHTLQLIVNHALKNAQINKTVSAARCLVEHFKNSELASTKLKAKQQQMGTPQHNLTQDVSVRWNSTFYMISRLLEQRWPVTATLSDPEVTQRGKRYLDLKGDQWSLLEELEQALKPFECATVFLSAQDYVTVSALPPLVKGLQKSAQNTSFETTAVKAFQAAAAEEIASRWMKETTFRDDAHNVCIIAAALDPRFRKLRFLSEEESLKVQFKIQALALQQKKVRERKHSNLMWNRRTQMPYPSLQREGQCLCWTLCWVLKIQMSPATLRETMKKVMMKLKV